MCGLLRKDLWCVLEEKTIASGVEMEDDTRGLPLTGEGDRLDDLDRLASRLPVFPTEAFGELRRGGFRCLGSYESGLLGFGVDILEGGGVDRD